MSWVLYLLSALIAAAGAVSAYFAPTELLGEREALYARLIMAGPAVLAATVVFALAAVVGKLTRLHKQVKKGLDLLATRGVSVSPAPALAEDFTPEATLAPEPAIAEPRLFEPAAAREPLPPEPFPAKQLAPAPAPELAPAPEPTPAPTRDPIADLFGPAPRETEALPPAPATPSPTERPAKRGFRLGPLVFGGGAKRSKDRAAPVPTQPGEAGVGLLDPAPEFTLPPIETAPAPAPSPTDSLTERLSAALLTANAEERPAPPPGDVSWNDRTEERHDDPLARIGRDALAEALFGEGEAESRPTQSEPQPPLFARAPEGEPPPSPPRAVPEPSPAPASKSAPIVFGSASPIIEGAPPAETRPESVRHITPPAPPIPSEAERAPTVGEFIERAEAEEGPPPPRVVREGQFAGRRYRMFEDGSIEIDTDQSIIRFASLDEFRVFVASAGRRGSDPGRTRA